MDRDPLGIYDDPIVIRFEIPWLRRVDRAERGTDTHEPAGAAADGLAPPPTDPPSPADLVARWHEGLAEAAAAEAARRASMPEARLVMGDVRGRPQLAVSGVSDGEITLWRRGSEAAAPQALAALTLDRDGSQLFAGGKFVGRWFEGEGEALFLPDWLRGISAEHVQLASDEPEGGPAPEDPEKRLLKDEFKRLEQAVPPLGGGRIEPDARRNPELQPSVPIIPRPALPERPVPPQALPPRNPPAQRTNRAVVTPDRRKHILEGNGSAGGHAPGRAMQGKTEFPATWSDDKIIDQIESVANDPESKRAQAARGRTVLEGTREGVVIRVVLGADGKTIITAFPINLSRRP